MEKLKVCGSNLTDIKGNPVQLRGISSYWLMPYRNLLSKESILTFRDKFKINCIRFPVSPYHYGVLGKKDDELSALFELTDIATELGLYVIIDWHVLGERDPMVSLEHAKDFFSIVVDRYKDNTNILYEICNEPNITGTWEKVGEYSKIIIPIIRAIDKESVILIGTPTWSQDVDLAVTKPFLSAEELASETYSNIMYSLHFYAATHKQYLRDKALLAINAGIGVFIDEFGLCDASGNGVIDFKEAKLWKEFIDEHNLSYINWNYSTCDESSAFLVHTCTKLYDFEEDDLSVQGKIIRSWWAQDYEKNR